MREARSEASGCCNRKSVIQVLGMMLGVSGVCSTVPAYWNLDTSVSKRQKINEKFSAEFRGEFFNVFNHPIFAQPASGVTCSATTCNLSLTGSTPDVAATNPVLGSGGARRVQLGVKVIF
jgi:hypothetical protein